MHRRTILWKVIPPLLLLLSACQDVSTAVPPTLPAESPTPNVSTVQPTTAPAPAYQLRLHPDGGLYAGDQVSFEVIAPPDADTEDQVVEIEVLGDTPANLGTQSFGMFGIGGRRQASFNWAWDTAVLAADEYLLSISIEPAGIQWVETVTLQPQADLPPWESQTSLEHITSNCCQIYYLSGTAAERDIEELAESSDQAADQIAGVMGVALDEKVDVVLLPRVIGHGGFAANGVYVSYLDRDYAGSDYQTVFKHELVHTLDQKGGGGLRPTFLAEGLAVYLSGGHYHTEALLPRAAALVDMQTYIPLQALAEDLHAYQHETGYLEAAAFVEYLVETWGYPAFDSFYRDIQPQESGSQAEAIDLALQEHYVQPLDRLESDFLAALQELPDSEEVQLGVSNDFRYYDTVRRYQLILDPSAYYLNVWLVTLNELREGRGLADYQRRPQRPENLTLELLLVSAHQQLQQGEYAQARVTLDATNAALSALENGAPEPMQAHPLVADTYQVADVLQIAGYLAQQVRLEGETARALAIDPQGAPVVLELARSGDTWTIMGLNE